jgi:hypothetical protein
MGVAADIPLPQNDEAPAEARACRPWCTSSAVVPTTVS